MAKALGVAQGESRGLLIIGANPVARAIGKVLRENDYDVLLVDSHWPHVSEARMKSLPTFHGNPVSQIADQRLDLVGFGFMLGLSSNDDLNVLSAQRYLPEFGSKRVFSLRKTIAKKNPEKHAASEEMRGRPLFGDGISYAKLASLIAKGAEVKSTGLGEEFSIDDYQAMYVDRVIPLFVIKESGKLEVVSGSLTDIDAPAGSTIVSLIQPQAEENSG